MKSAKVIHHPRYDGAHFSTVEDEIEALRSAVQSVLGYIPAAEHAAIAAYTSTTDVSSYIQDAVDAAPSDGIGLYFPAGRYRVGSAVTLDKPGYYFGDGEATLIQTTSAASNIFTVSADFAEVAHFKFDSTVTRSGGYYVEATGNRFRLSHFHMENALNGVNIDVVATATIEHGSILNCVAATGVPIRISDGFDVSIVDILSDQAAQTFAGIYIVNTGDVTIQDCNLIHCGQAIFLNPSAGDAISSVWAGSCFFDTSTRGLYALAAGGDIQRCAFTRCWFSSAIAEGVRAEISSGTIDGLLFTDCEVFLNGGNGYSIVSAGVKNFRVLGGACAGNGDDGIHVVANTQEFSFQGVRIGTYAGLGGNTDAGIVIEAGTSNHYQIIGNDLRGNGGANLSDGGTGVDKNVTLNLT